MPGPEIRLAGILWTRRSGKRLARNERERDLWTSYSDKTAILEILARDILLG